MSLLAPLRPSSIGGKKLRSIVRLAVTRTANDHKVIGRIVRVILIQMMNFDISGAATSNAYGRPEFFLEHNAEISGFVRIGRSWSSRGSFDCEQGVPVFKRSLRLNPEKAEAIRDSCWNHIEPCSDSSHGELFIEIKAAQFWFVWKRLLLCQRAFEVAFSSARRRIFAALWVTHSPNYRLLGVVRP